MSELNIQEVLSYLPQRYPFIFIDKVAEYEAGKSLLAIKNVTVNEPFFTGHFPGRPVMPGVLILEALAQASIILANLSLEVLDIGGGLHLFVGIDKARFKQIVEPGDQMQLRVDLVGVKHGIWKLRGVASVGDKVVCSADLMSATREIKK